MPCSDGLYLSIYAHVDALCAALDVPLRHDQNMALWRKTGDRVHLVRYWEFERYSGQKHHSRSFASLSQALAAIDAMLAEVDVRRSDIRAILGTPGLSRDAEVRGGSGRFNPHTQAHLWGAMLADTDRFFGGDMIGLALDGGPDTVLQRPGSRAPIYAGAVSRQGETRLFPISSPGPIWTALRHLTGLQEGSLMALASAAEATYLGPVDRPPRVETMSDYAQAHDWVQRWHTRISALDASHAGDRHSGFDRRFGPVENRIAMLAKIVQRTSDAQLCETLETILDAKGLDPTTTVLAMSGGVALNCRSNALAMETFGFAGFQSIPAVNDSGISLGYGLMYFHQTMGRFQFTLEGSGYGGPAQDHVSGEAVSQDTILDDLAHGPIVWIEGGAEIGPRALGHRSLLADPRTFAMKDRLNDIKRRQWWRPVAPVVLAEHVGDWFVNGDISPFMLRTFTLRPERADDVPAISHLDRSARIQTLDAQDAPRLHALIQAFHRSTGIPMLCNTSLNDKDEPIINTLGEAIGFAQRRGIPAVYVDGRRLAVTPDAVPDTSPRPDRPLAHLFVPDPGQIEEVVPALNPHGLSRDAVALHRFMPQFEALDITDADAANRLRRVTARLARTGWQPWMLML